MHLQCTKKMLDFLQPEITLKNTDDDFFAWHAEYIIIVRRKLLVLMNDLTRFCVVLFGVKKSDFKSPVEMLKRAVFFTMEQQGYDPRLIRKYVEGITDVTYSATKNRKLVARLNRSVFDVWWYIEDNLYFDQLEQPLLSQMLNESPVGENNWKISYFPEQKMAEYLKLLE